MSNKNRIIAALDVSGREEALRLVNLLKNEVGVFKIGMQLYNSEGPSIVREINAMGGKLFIDLKFHDIPNTVAQASRVMTGENVYMFNVHAAGGFQMMKAAADAARDEAAKRGFEKPKVIAVTVLTSINQEMFNNEIGIDHPISEQVVKWAKLARQAGLDGVVASPQEIIPIRQACGEDFLIVTPGVRPSWADVNDQQRIMTPKEALANGASYLVIGRPITAQSNPAAAAQRISAEMDEVK